MKNLFEEPKLILEQFQVQDSGFETGEDELDPAYGNTPVYG